MLKNVENPSKMFAFLKKYVIYKSEVNIVNSKQVAEYFLGLSEPEYDDIISNLKLPKLVYYA